MYTEKLAYMHSHSDSFQIQVIIEYWVAFTVHPCWLFIFYTVYLYLLYSLCMLILSSWFIPPPHISPLTISLFSISRGYNTKWSKSEKGKYHMIALTSEIYLQNRNRLTDIKGWCLLKIYSLSTTKTDKNGLFKDEKLDPPRCQISLFVVVVVQLLSRVQLFVTPWTAECQVSLSFTVFWSLLKLMSIKSVMPSKHLMLCCPLLLLPSIFTIIRVFSSESALRIRWSKYWSFSISPSNEYSGLISFRIQIALKYYRGKHLSICPGPLMLTSEPGCLAVLMQVCPL